MFSDKNCHCNLCRFLPLLNSIISSNKRYLHNRNLHKITLKRCLMNRRSPVSANMLVLWSKLLCSRKQQLFLRSWRLPASEINANNYRLHQMKWITCSLRNFLWGFEFGWSKALMSLKRYSRSQKKNLVYSWKFFWSKQCTP